MKRLLRRKGCLILMACALLGVGAAWLACWQALRFTPEKWQACADRHCSRIRMVDDLVRRYDLVGMSRADVVALLGEPDDPGYFPDWDMEYWVGDCLVDNDWFILKLDDAGRVAEFMEICD